MTTAVENSQPNTKPEVDPEPEKPIEKSDKEDEKPVEPVEVDADLSKRIIKQLEYYFGNKNLLHDKFMLREITLDNGWISLDTMLNFKRLAGICSDKVIIASAVHHSSSDIVKVNDNFTKIRRNPDNPLPKNDDDYKTKSNAKTIYAKGFPLDMTIDQAEGFFGAHGEMCFVKLRKNADNKFKGSVFVEFVKQEDADKFLEQKDLKYKEDDDSALIIMTRNGYFDSKKHKVNDGSKNGGEEADSKVPEIEDVEYEKGRVLRIPNLENIATDRESIKGLFADHKVSWVNFQRGEKEAFVRFDGSAGEALKSAMSDGDKVMLCGSEIQPVVLEGEEELEYWKKAAQEKLNFFNRKRKFDRSGRGRSKRRKY